MYIHFLSGTFNKHYTKQLHEVRWNVWKKISAVNSVGQKTNLKWRFCALDCVIGLVNQSIIAT